MRTDFVFPRRFLPRRIDWYILSEIVGPFIGALFFFSFVFLMFQALRLADFFIIHGVSGWLLLKMASLMALSIMPTALPVAFLIAVLMGFGRLSADSELVAMKANGIGVMRLAAPVTGLAVIVAALSLALSMEWVPWGDWTFKKTLMKVSNTKVVTSIKEGTFTSGFFDLLIFADKVDTKTNRLKRVFIYDEREPSNPLAVIAKEGEVVSLKPSSQLGSAVMLKLFKGNIHRNDITTNTYEKIDFSEYKLYLKIDEGADIATIKPRMLTYEQLSTLIGQHTPGTPFYREFVTELWRRYALALAPLIFVFLGIGYGTVRTRAVRSGAILIAFGVIFTYWLMQAGVTVFAHNGTLPPVVAMQLPNLVMIAVAYRGFRGAMW